MKQHITREQFEELNHDEQRRLFDKLFPNIPELPVAIKGVRYGAVDINPEYLTIGRLIEFLDENERIVLKGQSLIKGKLTPVNIRQLEYPKGKLCDVLWENVKEILETNDKKET